MAMLTGLMDSIGAYQ